MPDPRDLTTLADVKAWLNLTSTVDDTLLGTLITAVSVAIETAVDRPILSAPVSETRDGLGGRAMAFAVTPVASVSTLTINGCSIPAALDVTSPGYLFSAARLVLLGYRFTRGLGNVAISYTAGYAEVPPDLAQAATELVALRYRERGHIGIASKGLAGETAAFLAKEMPPDVDAVVQRYRKVVPV